MKLIWVACICLGTAWHLGVLAADPVTDTNAAPKTSLRFNSLGTNGFSFSTGTLEGVLHHQGASSGLSQVKHVPTGTVLDASKGLMGHYRVFANGKRFGNAAWDWPSQSQLREDGSVETVWPATAERPFDLKALYRWADPATLDMETTVIAKSDLVDFESFLASYFAPAFTNASILVTTPTGSPSPNQWLPLVASRGDWQMSPRNADGTRMIKDGRWLIEPNPVNWMIVPDYALPLGVRSESKSGISALIMAPREECFAVAGPQQLEPHYSLYLCLFGKTVKSGETARARARMSVVAPLTPSMAIQLYQQYPAAQNKP